jgi:hypothetical protein
MSVGAGSRPVHEDEVSLRYDFVDLKMQVGHGLALFPRGGHVFLESGVLGAAMGDEVGNMRVRVLFQVALIEHLLEKNY